jgi:hypothetical protein
MSTKSLAYHGAGQALAYILTGKRFKYVTINSRIEITGWLTAGHVKNVKFLHNYEYYILDPRDFIKLLINDFQCIAGYVAEAHYSGERNDTGVKSDVQRSSDVVFQSEKLASKYSEFLFEYTKAVLTEKSNWSRLSLIAEALVEHKKLSYKEVSAITKKNEFKMIARSIA